LWKVYFKEWGIILLKQLNICKKCINKIGVYGRMPLELYVLLCELYSGGEVSTCFSGKAGLGETLFQFLEKKKFIITTELDHEKLIIKPIGHKKSRSRYMETHTVCAFQKDHKTKGKSGEPNLPQH